MPADDIRPLTGRALALTILLVALWGGNTVAVRFSVDSLPPVAVACLRFTMATLVMGAWCAWQRISLRLTRREAIASTVAGTLMFLQIASFNVAVLWTNATHGAMLINTFPFFVAGIEHAITGRERMTWRRIAGLCLAFCGVVAVMGDREMMGDAVAAFLAGDVLLLVSALLLAIRVVYVGRAVQFMPPSRLIFWHDVVGVILFAVWSGLTEDWTTAYWTAPAIWGLLYQGVIVAGFCFVAHAALLRHHGAAQISVFSFATPIFGVLFSVLLRAEPLTAGVLLGAALVAVGIWAVTVTPRAGSART